MNRATKIISSIFWVLVIVNGVYGFISTKNTDTLFICFICATVIAISYEVGIKDVSSAYLYIATISLVLAAFFGTNFAKHASPTMDGAMLLISSTTFAVAGLSWFALRNEKK